MMLATAVPVQHGVETFYVGMIEVLNHSKRLYCKYSYLLRLTFDDAKADAMRELKTAEQCGFICQKWIDRKPPNRRR